MSISAPRYAAGPLRLVDRPRRTLAIYLRELAARGSWATWLVVAISYASILLFVVFSAELAGTLGRLSVSTFYIGFTAGVWQYLILLVATAVASGSIAEDLASRSITLYLSRPIHLSDYLGAKVAAVATWIGITAIGPGIVAVFIVAGLGLSPFGVSLAAFAAFLAIGLLTTFFFTALGISLSALTGKPIYAGVGIFGVTLSSEIAAVAVQSATGRAGVLYVSPVNDVLAAASAAFQTGETTAINPVVAASLLAAIGTVLFILAWVRLRRVEVVGE